MTIAVQGQVLNNKVLSTTYNGLEEIDLVKLLNQEYSFPVFLQNEANLSALGEYTFSSDIENLVSISLHSGIGVGVVKMVNLTLVIKDMLVSWDIQFYFQMAENVNVVIMVV